MVKLLFVDDDEKEVSILQSYFQEKGYHAHVALNGIEAFDVFMQENPQVIVTDISMPEMDGIELAGKIRSQSSVPLVALTAHNEEKILTTLKSIGFNEILYKPVRITQIKKAVEKLLK